jgi:hypothetical protein
MGFCIVDYVLRRGDVLPKNFHWHGSTWNAYLPFSEQSNKFPLRSHLTDFKSTEYYNTNYHCFFLSIT